MISTLLQELHGPAPGKAGGLAAMTAGAAGAALFAKCRFEPAKKEMTLLENLALTDGGAFESYIKAKQAGEDVDPWLKEATMSPLTASETALGLLERLPEARESCPKSMIADLLVGAYLLQAAARGSAELVSTNLRLFPNPWEEGERRLANILSGLNERDRYRSLFRSTDTIAVIGISDQIEKPAYYVPSYLKGRGYRIWGVHPRKQSDLAEQTVARLGELRAVPDLVLIFRRSDKVIEHLEEILSIMPRAVWLQQGITNEAFSASLQDRGIQVVSDRCAMVEHLKLGL